MPWGTICECPVAVCFKLVGYRESSLAVCSMVFEGGYEKDHLVCSKGLAALSNSMVKKPNLTTTWGVCTFYSVRDKVTKCIEDILYRIWELWVNDWHNPMLVQKFHPWMAWF